MYKPRVLTINGVTKHLKEWAEIYDVPFSVVESRWDKGVRDILTLLSPRKECIKLTFRGETATLTQWSHRTGIKYDTLHARYRRNNNLESILSPWSDMSSNHINNNINNNNVSIKSNQDETST